MSDEQKPQENQSAPATSDRQPIFNLPLAVTALAGVMIAIHLARSFVFNELTDASFVAWFGFIPYRIIDPAALDGGVLPLLWTPVTHAFIHGGWEHLLFNTVWLAVFATPVARRYGAVPLLILFALSAVIGAAAFAATTLPGVAVLVGASGGVAGLTGAAVRFMFQPVLVAKHPETGEPVVLGRRLASLGELARDSRARAFIAIWIIFNAAVPLLPMLTGEAVGIAWQAHLGGFFTGLLLVPLFEEAQVIDRIEALETRIAHQDKTIDELNGTILDLWKQMEALRRQVVRLDDQLREVEAAGGPQGPEPRPPHY